MRMYNLSRRNLIAPIDTRMVTGFGPKLGAERAHPAGYKDYPSLPPGRLIQSTFSISNRNSFLIECVATGVPFTTRAL